MPVLFANWLRLTQKTTPIAVHCTFIVVVVLYALFGAAVFSALEQEDVSDPDFSQYETPTLTNQAKHCLSSTLNRTSNRILSISDAMGEIQNCYKQPMVPDSPPDWGYASSLLFTFTLITTIGYGNIAPVTLTGRVFCIIYGLIGIPLTMLAIANIGKFLVEGTKTCGKKFNDVFGDKLRAYRKGSRRSSVSTNHESDESEFGSRSASIAVMVAFVFYVAVGAIVLPLYEDEMGFSTAIYFNFVTLTTVGLGDMVPKSKHFLFFTLIYITVGLALTTIAIEVASDYLKKLHYFGRKLKNAAKVTIWFGGKKLTVGSLIRNFGEKYGIPEEELEDLNFLDNLVEEAIVKDENRNYRKAELPPEKPVTEGDLKDTANDHSIAFADDEEVSAPLITERLLESVPPPLPLPGRKTLDGAPPPYTDSEWSSSRMSQETPTDNQFVPIEYRSHIPESASAYQVDSLIDDSTQSPSVKAVPPPPDAKEEKDGSVPVVIELPERVMPPDLIQLFADPEPQDSLVTMVPDPEPAPELPIPEVSADKYSPDMEDMNISAKLASLTTDEVDDNLEPIPMPHTNTAQQDFVDQAASLTINQVYDNLEPIPKPHTDTVQQDMVDQARAATPPVISLSEQFQELDAPSAEHADHEYVIRAQPQTAEPHDIVLETPSFSQHDSARFQTRYSMPAVLGRRVSMRHRGTGSIMDLEPGGPTEQNDLSARIELPNPKPGKPDFKHDPRKRYELYQKEWAKHASPGAKKNKTKSRQ